MRCLQLGLRKAGWEVTGVTSVEEASQQLLKRNFDLIVTDYQLSGTRDGFSLLAHEKKRAAGPPVIVISGSRTAGLENRARAQGATAFLRKPFDLDQFLDVCRNALASETENRKEQL